MNQPEWLNSAVFYEIFPQSFQDTDGDGVGDLKGIEKRLGYIRDLGFNALWINPCFESPFMDAGYDISDYYRIAPRYGTNEDMAELLKEAHALGMHVFLDLVPGHTSTEHPWFRESMKAERNEYTDRYVWTDNALMPPRNFAFLRGISDRDGAAIVNCFSFQAALNYGFADPKESWQQPVDAPGPQATFAEMLKIMRFWLDMGCDGFRVDMAASLVKNDFEWGKWNGERKSSDFRESIRLWNKVRDMLDRDYPEAALVSEWGMPEVSLKAGFDMDFLLHFGPSHYMDLFRAEEPYFSARGKGSIREFAEYLMKIQQETGDMGLVCVPSGNHDMDRMSRFLTAEEIRIAFAFLLSLPGAPFVYYGDEIGLRYIPDLVSVEGGYGRTGSRAPMCWDDSENCGFSTAPAEKLYIRQDDSGDRPTVKEQEQDENSILRAVKKLLKLRSEHTALQSRAKIEFLETGYPVVYRRRDGEESIVVLINPSDVEHPVAESSLRSTDGSALLILGDGLIQRDGLVFIAPRTAVFMRENIPEIPWKNDLSGTDFITSEIPCGEGKYYDLFEKKSFASGDSRIGDIRYYVYDPTQHGFPKEGKYPVIYAFHGSSSSLHGITAVNWSGVEWFASPEYQERMGGAYIICPLANEYMNGDRLEMSWMTAAEHDVRKSLCGYPEHTEEEMRRLFGESADEMLSILGADSVYTDTLRRLLEKESQTFTSAGKTIIFGTSAGGYCAWRYIISNPVDAALLMAPAYQPCAAELDLLRERETEIWICQSRHDECVPFGFSIGPVLQKLENMPKVSLYLPEFTKAPNGGIYSVPSEEEMGQHCINNLVLCDLKYEDGTPMDPGHPDGVTGWIGKFRG